MPRVTDEYVQRRRREILEAAWRCFAKDGFHATSMDDVIASAGVSANVVYRWFKGKDDLIVASAQEALHGVVDALQQAASADPPTPLADAVELVLTTVLERTTQHQPELTALAVQAWAEALRNPTVHELVVDIYTQLRASFAELVTRHQEAGTLPADLDPDQLARPLFSLMPGFLLQRTLLGDVDPRSYAHALRALLRA
jgi:AcrR family transcriptional regulator